MDLQEFKAGNNAPMIISVLQPEVHTLCQLPATCGPLRQEHGPLQAVWRANPQERVRGPHGGVPNGQGGVCLWEDDWEMQVRNSQGQIKTHFTVQLYLFSLPGWRVPKKDHSVQVVRYSCWDGKFGGTWGLLWKQNWEMWKVWGVHYAQELWNSSPDKLCSKTILGEKVLNC